MHVQPTNEFSLLAENAAELGLDFAAPQITRYSTPVGEDQQVSAIQWGLASPSFVLLHGGGQNAHTWDTVLLALGRDALAIDLPGHGHSDWRSDHDYSGQTNAAAVAEVLARRATTPVSLVGMSLGGLTALSLTSRFPDLVKRLLLVDVTPQSLTRHGELTPAQRGSVALTSGPATFASFDAILAATVAASPHRSRSSLRRGVLHNAKELADGSWGWRYDMRRMTSPEMASPRVGWDEWAGIRAPVTLVRGANSGFVHDDDVQEMRRLNPDLMVHVVAVSGHSVQSDQPLQLVELLREFLAAAR